MCLDARRVHKDSLRPPTLPRHVDRETAPGVEYIGGLSYDEAQRCWGYNGPGYYFWDETQAYCHGPYAQVADAVIALNHYVERLNQEG